MNLAEFAGIATGDTVLVSPDMVGAIVATDRGVLLMLKIGLTLHVQGLVESTARVLHQATLREWSPPDEQSTTDDDGIEYGLHH